jgi:hypothetical protein
VDGSVLSASKHQEGQTEGQSLGMKLSRISVGSRGHETTGCVVPANTTSVRRASSRRSVKRRANKSLDQTIDRRGGDSQECKRIMEVHRFRLRPYLSTHMRLCAS